MTISEWLKLGLYGAILGASTLALIGFNWAGWETAAGAETRAAARAATQVTAALVPVCVERSRSDPANTVKLEMLRVAPLANRPDLLMQTGWATPPGIKTADRGLARACLEALAVAAP